MTLICFSWLMQHIKFTIPIPFISLGLIIIFAKKLLNLINRPNLHFGIEYTDINFLWNKSGITVQKLLRYPCITIVNKSKKIIKIGNIKLNGVPYISILHGDYNFYSLRCKTSTRSDYIEKSNNSIYEYFYNEEKNTSSVKILNVAPYEKITLPFLPIGENSHFLRNKPLPTLIFFPKNKFIIEIEMNSKKYQYSISKLDLYEKIINFLAFRQ